MKQEPESRGSGISRLQAGEEVNFCANACVRTSIDLYCTRRLHCLLRQSRVESSVTEWPHIPQPGASAFREGDPVHDTGKPSRDKCALKLTAITHAGCTKFPSSGGLMRAPQLPQPVAVMVNAQADAQWSVRCCSRAQTCWRQIRRATRTAEKQPRSPRT